VSVNQLASREIPLASSGCWQFFVPTSTGMRVVGDPSFEDWSEAFGGLKKINGCIQWLLGDMVVHGANYGERYSQFLEASDYEEKTIRNADWVARSVSVSRRRDTLSWSHHAEVARLEPEQQNKWLQRAEAECLTLKQLRDLLRQERNEKERFYPPEELDFIEGWLRSRREQWPEAMRDKFVSLVRLRLDLMEIPSGLERGNRAGAAESNRGGDTTRTDA
jgi:hypothetical protein